MKDTIRGRARELARELEASIMAAVAARGVFVGNGEDMRKRVTRVCVSGSGCTYYLDGRPILWAGDIEVHCYGQVVSVERKITMFGKEGIAR